MKRMSKKVKRLFGGFKPKHYELSLIPDRDAMTFTGNVTIAGYKTHRPNKRITLHQVGLTITGAALTKHDKKGDQTFMASRINNHDAFDEVRLHTEQMLYPGEYTIKLTFKGKITRPMDGLYPCVFQHKGKEQVIMATQFESHFARQVFPCIDEPEAKATFSLTLTTPANETVLANTPVKSQKKHGRNIVTTFETTPIMSTYLLAFIFGELKYKEARTKTGITVRAYATPDNVEHTDFALDIAVKCLEFYSNYFGISYPLPKCDLVALPDFAAGAMENWGCITFREQALLVDPNHTSLAAKQQVALVVAHELTHQWFGNLVTMRWWTDLWLNEGFASWMEYLAINHLFPEWQMWVQFIVDEQHQALKLDALEHTHPVEVSVNHPDEIRTIFDAISYSKGASVIHMLHDYLGAKAFKDGLHHYLNKHAYSNTDTVDLWDAMETISKKPVKNFMHAWTSQPGFPLLTATVHQNKIEISQERFIANSKHRQTSEIIVWPVPLLAATNVPNDTLIHNHGDFEMHYPDKLKLNQGQSGFYRVLYDNDHLDKLGRMVVAGTLLPLDRLGLLDDLLESAKAGKVTAVKVLDFLENFHSEDNYAVWDVIATLIGALRLLADEEPLREAMKPFIRDLTAKQVKRLGWDHKKSESHFDRLLRPIVLGLAASADEPSLVEKCQNLFLQMSGADNIANIDPDLRGVLYGTVARLGDRPEFNKLLALHNASTNSEERITLTAALTSFKQPVLHERALRLINSKNVRLQDVSYWLAYSFMNRHAKKQTWRWMKAHWAWLRKNLGNDLSFCRMPVYAARVFSDDSFLKEYKKFFGTIMEPALERSFKQGVEIIELQSAWKARDHDAIKQYFAHYNSAKN